MGMYRSVMQYLDSHTEWNGLTAFEGTYQQIVDKYNILKGLSLNQAAVITGYGSDKREKREILAERTLEFVGALKSLAAANHDAILKDQMKISYSALIYKKESLFIIKVDSVIEAATEHLAQLGDFGITQAKLDELVTLRAEMEAIITAPRRAVIDRRVFNEQIKKIIHEIDILFREQLDPLMIQFKATAFDFYTGYTAAREIVNLRGRSKDPETGFPEEPAPPVDDGE